ncbi:hypothetical protein JTB14_004783 [Gonioctena quinquepunctata]|nr:hypothetical protein JTB14_004783 [Gonioctena quinquepunctata]
MSCAHCKKITGIPTFSCDGCERSVHGEQKCCGLNASELKVMDQKSGRNLKFYCGDCQMSVTLIPKLLASIINMQAEINELRIRIDSSPTTWSEDNIIDEISERESKKKNVMVYNLPEKSQDLDLKQAQAIVKEITKEELRVIGTHRVGKKNKNGARALKITFSNPDDALKVISNKKNLGKRWNVFILADLTERQAAQSKKGQEEKERRTEKKERTKGKKGKKIREVQEDEYQELLGDMWEETETHYEDYWDLGLEERVEDEFNIDYDDLW